MENPGMPDECASNNYCRTEIEATLFTLSSMVDVCLEQLQWLKVVIEEELDRLTDEA